MKKINYIIEYVNGKHFAMLWGSRVLFNDGHESEDKAIEELKKYCNANNIELGKRLKVI